jgi:hypothetical protein
VTRTAEHQGTLPVCRQNGKEGAWRYIFRALSKRAKAAANEAVVAGIEKLHAQSAVRGASSDLAKVEKAALPGRPGTGKNSLPQALERLENWLLTQRVSGRKSKPRETKPVPENRAAPVFSPLSHFCNKERPHAPFGLDKMPTSRLIPLTKWGVPAGAVLLVPNLQKIDVLIEGTRLLCPALPVCSPPCTCANLM